MVSLVQENDFVPRQQISGENFDRLSLESLQESHLTQRFSFQALSPLQREESELEALCTSLESSLFERNQEEHREG